MSKRHFKHYLVLLSLAAMPYLGAHPKGFHLKSGRAKPPVIVNKTCTIETGEKAIINWDSFSVGRGETTRFVMPSSNSAVLNRVIGSNLTRIYGSLEANGKIFLINTKGIIIGNSAQINAASFFASTLDILDQNFLGSGTLHFTGDSKKPLLNMGNITAWDGNVVLISHHVDNSGTLEAPNGTASVASGQSVYIQSSTNGRIIIRTEALEDAGVDQLKVGLKKEGNPYSYAIKNARKTDANITQKKGGRTLLVAERGRNDPSRTLSTEDIQYALLESAEASSQMFNDLTEAADFLLWDDWFCWNDFTLVYDCCGYASIRAKGVLSSPDVVESKGLSIRRRRENLKYSPIRNGVFY